MSTGWLRIIILVTPPAWITFLRYALMPHIAPGFRQNPADLWIGAILHGFMIPFVVLFIILAVAWVHDGFTKDSRDDG